MNEFIYNCGQEIIHLVIGIGGVALLVSLLSIGTKGK